MVEIVRRMGWSYISIIYEESNYGIKVSWICTPYCSHSSTFYVWAFVRSYSLQYAILLIVVGVAIANFLIWNILSAQASEFTIILLRRFRWTQVNLINKGKIIIMVGQYNINW